MRGPPDKSFKPTDGPPSESLAGRNVEAGWLAWLAGWRGEKRSNDEFAGVWFSPDGQTMFANIQTVEGVAFSAR